MINAPSQQTLGNISGQNQLKAATGFAGTMQNLAQIQLQRQQQARQAELQKVQMQKAKFEMDAAIGEQVQRDRAVNMPTPSKDATAKDWMKYGRVQEAGGYTKAAAAAYEFAAAAGSGQPLPIGYKNFPELTKLQADKRRAIAEGRANEVPAIDARIKLISDASSEASQWQYKVALAAIPEKDRTPAQQRQLESMLPKGTNVYIGNPSTAKMENTIMSLQNSMTPDGNQTILDSMDEKSKASYITAVSNIADRIVAASSKGDNPIDRTTAIQMAEEELKKRVVPVATMRETIPFIGSYFDKQYGFVTPEIEDTIEKDLIDRNSAGKREPVQIGEWLFDPVTHENLGRAK